MSDSEVQEAAPDKAIAYVVYILYIVGLSVGGIALVAGVIVAFLARRRATDRLLRSHYTFQIRAFWYGFLALVAAIVVALALVITESTPGLLLGVIALFVIGVIAFIVFVIVGILKLYRDESFDNLG